eukprot:TRINITY_DN11755_c0_g1_i4.p1 TRINITY_DN11755_c0_g1~~TRINITY_DN11755_c0_g1_i4.p1  ORF type:complete len:390 (+),score=103.76 TRINITY_DN11755_c0_g1_i4:175-1344(+)
MTLTDDWNLVEDDFPAPREGLGAPRRSFDREVYVCDLPGSLSEDKLRDLLARYGEISNLELVTSRRPPSSEGGGNKAVFCEFVVKEAALEAAELLNNALVRGRPVRCLLRTHLEVIRATLAPSCGRRLFLEGLDAAIEGRGLLDLATLFGHVLDCKVGENLGDDTTVAFVHFARAEEATKAQSFLDGMRVGSSIVKVRPYVEKDAQCFGGCDYGLDSLVETVPTMKAAEEEEVVAPPPPPQEAAEAFEHFAAMKYHVMEAYGDEQERLERLGELTTLYRPRHDQQMLVAAKRGALQGLVDAVCRCGQDAVDVAILHASLPQKEKEEILRDYSNGNIYVLFVDIDSLFDAAGTDRPAFTVLSLSFLFVMSCFRCSCLCFVFSRSCNKQSA